MTDVGRFAFCDHRDANGEVTPIRKVLALVDLPTEQATLINRALCRAGVPFRMHGVKE